MLGLILYLSNTSLPCSLPLYFVLLYCEVCLGIHLSLSQGAGEGFEHRERRIGMTFGNELWFHPICLVLSLAIIDLKII